jgi:scyllo-inositol 2-dehydrogenase (NADP+)
MTKIRVGLAGAGWVMGARHLPSFRSHPDVEIAAIYDRRPDRAARLADSAKMAIPTYHELDKFLAEGLDVVSIATSPWSHRDIAVSALASGAHVFTEKPMAMDSREAADMVAAASDAHRLLCVSHNFLFSRSLQAADRRLAGRRVDYAAGVQLSSEARRLPEWYRELPGGLMFDEMPHMLYSLNHYLGGGLEVDHVRASFDADRHPRTVELLLRGNTGQGQITMVFCAPVSEWHLMLSTPEQLVSLDLFRDIAINVSPDGAHKAKDIARTSAAVLSGHVAGFAKAGSRLARKRQFWGHDVVIPLFVEATRGNGPVPVPVEDAVSVVRVTDQVLADLGLTVPRP